MVSRIDVIRARRIDGTGGASVVLDLRATPGAAMSPGRRVEAARTSGVLRVLVFATRAVRAASLMMSANR